MTMTHVYHRCSICGDEHECWDRYTRLAALVYGIEEKHVTRAQRETARCVAYAAAYGAGAEKIRKMLER